MMGPRNLKRDRAVWYARQEGRTLRDIADEYGISHERARQIAWKMQRRVDAGMSLYDESPKTQADLHRAIGDARRAERKSPRFDQ